jgi:hypothetical protein
VKLKQQNQADGPIRMSGIDRRRARLEKDGHTVRPITIPTAVSAIDKHVDSPPYSHNPYLKRKLMDYGTHVR